MTQLSSKSPSNLIDIKIDLSQMGKISSRDRREFERYMDRLTLDYRSIYDPWYKKYQLEHERIDVRPYKGEPFWSKFYLLKHKADEEDDDGEPIYVYSIVRKSDWDFGRKTIDQSQDYMTWARNLPTQVFEEVAANWFEMIGSDDDFNDFIKMNEVKVINE